ncbi:hypothetical protein J2Y58_000696 [Sphingomonas sp. BE138]|uniref:Transposase n=1 Tax=Sphingobium scionense TaxID=1404341 RepID=A0A7W6LQI8_9SPHN|nr:hypothetical protein [Sphingobium scionense]MDR6787355.1 hypothetical protein [Sphingomonas sp. BE138]
MFGAVAAVALQKFGGEFGATERLGRLLTAIGTLVRRPRHDSLLAATIAARGPERGNAFAYRKASKLHAAMHAMR